MDEIVAEFLVESRENLDRLDAEFVELEQDPNSGELLGSIFRTIHTIKGTAAFLDFGQLERVAHNAENLLSLLRDGKMALDSQLTTILLEAVDAIRVTLDVIEESGTDSSQDFAELSARLAAIVDGDRAPAGAPQPAVVETVAVVGASDVAPVDEAVPADDFDGGAEALPEFPADAAAPEVMAPVEAEAVDPTPFAGAPDDDERLDEVPADAGTVPVATSTDSAPADEITPDAAMPAAAAPAEAPAPNGASAPAAPAAEDDHGDAAHRRTADTTIRVDVGLLDRLMNLVSELVLARNQIRQFAEQSDPTFQSAVQDLDLVTSDLQQAVMDTRMQPVGNLFGRLPRMVRDLANTCGKRVKLEMSGEETELDKTLLEAIRDPLTHVVRNSVDHGLESPEARIAAGKPETGVVRLSARHEGGQVIIDIIDDGAGLDLDRISAKVVERGLMNPDQVAALSDREVAQLIFLPGLSTAKAVTKVSGRGVGMDVVKRSIDEIGGTVEIQTEMGMGTTLTLRIPLTLAIIPALSVRCGQSRYLIPQLNVLELHRVSDATPIELIGGAPLYRLRGELLPIIHWADALDDHSVPVDERALEDPQTWTGSYVVVLKAHGVTYGLAVDRVESTEEIVVKPLRSHLKDTPAFAGSTVLGDGSVALILDPTGLTARSGISVDAVDDPMTDAAKTQMLAAETDTVLTCEVGGRRIGFPLSGVTRLENFDFASIDLAGDAEVVQYRDRLMRLVRPQHQLGYHGGHDVAPPDRLYVLVHERADETTGVVVDRICEVQQAPVDGGREGHGPILRSVPIEGLVTDIVDMDALVESGMSAGAGFSGGGW